MSALESILQEAEAQLEKLPDTDGAELMQYYRDLGYLPPTYMATPGGKATLQKADVAFKRDLRASGLFTPAQLQKLRLMHRDSFLLEALRLLMDFDEGTPLPRMPEVGEVSLLSRLVHYRLFIYGLYAHKVDRPFGGADQPGRKQLRTYTGLMNDLEAVNLLADKEGLTQRLLRFWGYDEGMLVFQISEPPATLDPEEFRMNRAFIAMAKRDLKRSPQETERLEKAILRTRNQNLDWSFIYAHTGADIYRFFIRLIQVHQWTSGLYTGALNGEMEAITLGSVQTVVQLYNQSDPNDEDLHLKKMLAYLGEGYWVFNATHFLKIYMIEQGAGDPTESKVISELSYHADQLSPQVQREFTQRTQQLMREAEEDLKEESRDVIGRPFRRIYQGVKSFFRNLFRWGRKMVDAIIRKAKGLWTSLREMFCRIIRGARRALLAFVNGVKMVLGKLPLMTAQAGEVGLSQLELTGDGFSVIPKGWSAQDLHQHRKAVMRFENGIQFSLMMLGELLRFAQTLVVGIVAWPLLLLQIVNSFKLVMKKYQAMYSTT
ncbi:MAG TPA: hypothetical protein DCE41_04230 [Cytophagales bacterium]|nr:hypothetical protein [Cytophagales bacterium]HAP61490.1 hypothetical protein [Cytophagales bacterium]